MNLHARTLRSGLLGALILIVLLGVDCARADLRDRYVAARGESSASAARGQMERILAADDDPDISAQAAVWLGQYEYTLGRLESAFGYFQRATQLARDGALFAQAEFWSDHTANLLVADPHALHPAGPVQGDLPGGADSGSVGARPPGRRSGGAGPVGLLDPIPAYQVLGELAEGDGRMRSGEFQAAIRVYLEAEGRARDLGRLGPLAYRAALSMTRALEDGKADPLFETDAVESWDAELAEAPERGLVFALLRAGETIGTSRESVSSEFANPVPRGEDSGTVESRKWGDGAEGILTPDDPPSTRGTSSARAEPGRSGTVGQELFVIQLGAFRDRERAREEMERLTSRGLSVRLELGTDPSGDRVFRIRLGAPSSRQQAEALAARVLEGVPHQLVLVEP